MPGREIIVGRPPDEAAREVLTTPPRVKKKRPLLGKVGDEDPFVKAAEPVESAPRPEHASDPEDVCRSDLEFRSQAALMELNYEDDVDYNANYDAELSRVVNGDLPRRQPRASRNVGAGISHATRGNVDVNDQDGMPLWLPSAMDEGGTCQIHPQVQTVPPPAHPSANAFPQDGRVPRSSSKPIGRVQYPRSAEGVAQTLLGCRTSARPSIHTDGAARTRQLVFGHSTRGGLGVAATGLQGCKGKRFQTLGAVLMDGRRIRSCCRRCRARLGAGAGPLCSTPRLCLPHASDFSTRSKTKRMQRMAWRETSFARSTPALWPKSAAGASAASFTAARIRAPRGAAAHPALPCA